MNIFRSIKAKKQAHKSRGMRMTEGLLPVFGPAQVGDTTAPIRPVSAQEAAREASLESTMERKVAADGSVYLVERTH